MCLQVAGRNVILFVVFGSLDEMQNKPVVFLVFYLWSTIEIFRLAQIAFLLSPVEDMSLVLTLAQPPLHQIPVLHAGLHQHRVEDANVAAVHHLDSSLPAGSHS